MVWNLFSLIIGLAALVVGAELMIRGGASIGLRARLRPIVVGLTIVAFGTSCPELFICTVAAIKGGEATAVSIGSIVGSNIFNILAILGFAALIRPISIQSQTMKYEMPTPKPASGADPDGKTTWLQRYDVPAMLDGFWKEFGRESARRGAIRLPNG